MIGAAVPDPLPLAVFGPHADEARWRALDEGQAVALSCHAGADAAVAALRESGTPLGVLASSEVVLGRDVPALAARAVGDPALDGIPWLLLGSDGAGIDGTEVDNGSYLDHAVLGSRFPVRALGAGSPHVAVVALDQLRRLPAGAPLTGIGDVAALGWQAGRPSYLSPHVRFSFPGRRSELRRAARPLAGATADALRAARPDPTLTIAVRTALRRPYLLERAIASVAAAAARRPAERVLVLGVVPAPELEAEVERLRGMFAGLALEAVAVPAEPGVEERAAAVTAGLAEAATDYVWFVDDDDALEPGALAAARDAVHARERPLIVAGAVEVEERWEGAGLVGATETRRYDPRRWPGALTGWNPLPFTSLVVPRRTALDRLTDVPLRAGRGEDYALLLALLTSADLQVVVVDEVLARVSIRPGGDNVVTEADRTEWLRAVSDAMGALAADPAGGQQVRWELGERLRDSVPAGRGAGAGAGAEPAWKTAAKRLVPAALHPAAKRALTWARGGRRHLDAAALEEALAGTVALMPAVPYHVEELLPLAEALGRRGVPAAFLVSDHRWEGLRAHLKGAPFPVLRCLPAGDWVRGAAALLTMNDWAEVYRDVVVRGNEAGVPTFAKVEGVQDFADDDVVWERRAYRTAAHVLGQGPNDAAALAGADVHVVGSTRLERMWLAPPRPAAGADLAVINLNFTYGVLAEARLPWLESALEACAAAGLPHAVSLHPAETDPPPGTPVAREPAADLLERAAVLVSRFSTLPFEAMARGVPFVYHNPHGERVPTFAEPGGAFEVTRTTAELKDALAAAGEWAAGYRERCAPFFLRQVDVDPSRPAAERGADAIVAIAGLS